MILLWAVALLGVGTAGSATGDEYANPFNALPGTESGRANELLEEAFPQRLGESDTIVWRVDQGSVRDEDVRNAMTRTLGKVAKLPVVSSVETPYTEQGASQISEDGRTAYATVTVDSLGGQPPAEQMETVVDTARAPAGDGLQVEIGGTSVELTEDPPGHLSEIVGIAAAAVVLFFAFGSLYAMLLPIVTALFAIGIASSSIILLSHVVDIVDVASLLAVLIGLGVGVDYALFIVTRHRKGLLSGRAPVESAVAAVNTSGRAVLFAGGTVCIALVGMFAIGLTFINGIAIAASLAVALTLVASVTLLPALLGVLGMRVLSRRQRGGAEAKPQRGRHTARNLKPPKAGKAARWSAFVERHPRALAGVAVTVLAAIAVPALSLRLVGLSDQGNNPETTTTRKAYDLLADGFGPGFNGPLTVVAEVPGESDLKALDGLSTRVREDRGVAAVAPEPVKPGAKVAVMQVIPTTSPQDRETDELVDRLRDDVVPAAEQGSSMQAFVGGQTAGGKDFSSVVADKLPWFLGVILVLGFVLLLMAFRSLMVPFTAVLMNLTAAAATFGVMVAIFQFGWGGETLGFGREGPIDAFLPVAMLSLLFGLSMDYQVFLLSRMYEEWLRSRDNARAVRVGLTETSGVINSAGAIMIFVFGSFVLNGDRPVVIFGVGLAGAVALDAFLLRTMLVPALMHLFGKGNWYLPAWFGKILPNFVIEPPDDTAPAPAPPPKVDPAGTDPGRADPTDAEPLVNPPVIHGAVQSAHGAPVVGAALTLISRSGRPVDHVVSNSFGGYLLTASDAGSYLLAATAAGYEPEVSRVMVEGLAVEHWVVLGGKDDRDFEDAGAMS